MIGNRSIPLGCNEKDESTYDNDDGYYYWNVQSNAVIRQSIIIIMI